MSGSWKRRAEPGRLLLAVDSLPLHGGSDDPLSPLLCPVKFGKEAGAGDGNAEVRKAGVCPSIGATGVGGC